jgi:multicomponent Na+:H+ antiporter subunit D
LTNETFLAPFAILIPLGTAFALPIVVRIARPLRQILCTLSLILTCAVLLIVARPVFEGETLVYWMSSWEPRDGLAIGISLSIDAWGVVTALIAAGVGLAVVVYSSGYMRGQTGQGPYYVLVMLLVTALIGFSLSGDMFNQFVWLEVFSVSAFALTGYNTEDRRAVEAAFKYLITNSIASFFITVALVLLYMQTGALGIAHIAREVQATPAGLVAIGLLIGGYATKAALVPWHFWLPDAHSVAPAPISALFSGALIKVGIYAIGRVMFTLFPAIPAVQTGLMIAAVITMLLGGVQMLRQNAIKRVLAFSSVAQIGYIALGLSLGTPAGIAAAAAHMVHHALAKAALFMGAGAIATQTGTTTLDNRAGLLRSMPITFAVMVVAGLSLAGMPFLSGYISKTLLEEAVHYQHLDFLIPIIILASSCTFAGIARLIWFVFIPARTGNSTRYADASAFMLIPMIAMAIGSIIYGISPVFPVEVAGSAAAHALTERDHYIQVVMDGVESGIESDAEVHREPAPSPTDVSHWGVPLIVAVVGSLLAFAMITHIDQPIVRLVRRIPAITARVHTGMVNDYALWNAFGTGFVLIVLLLARGR